MSKLNKKLESQSGYLLIMVLMFITVIGLVLTSYYSVVKIDLATLNASKNYEQTFFTAEAGLNIRADNFRSEFERFNLPNGGSPEENHLSLGVCDTGNTGSGSFACETYNIGNNSAETYVLADPTNPQSVVVPVGEAFAGLNAAEYRYDVIARGLRKDGSTGANLGLRFKSRVVPIFQFAGFYDGDLELTPIRNMYISGPIHTNGNLYITTAANLDINGQITVGKDIWRGRKYTNSCFNGDIAVVHTTPSAAWIEGNSTHFSTSSNYSCGSGNSRRNLSSKNFNEWNGMILQDIDRLEIPTVSDMDPGPGNRFWDLADIRLVLNLNGSDNVTTVNSSSGVEVRNVDGSLNSSLTTTLDTTCSGVVRSVSGNNFHDQIRNKYLRVLDIYLEDLLTCLNDEGIVDSDNSSNGGIVIHATVEGNNSGSNNRYGVRVRDASRIRAIGGPVVKGLSIVSDQPIYTLGDFNRFNWRPASLYGDAFTPLSNNWNDSISTASHTSRNATSTTINAAIVAGSILTGGAQGVAGHGKNPNSAGFNNFPRLLEDWDRGGSTQTLNMDGSFVSLSNTTRAGGTIQTNVHYTPPNRAFTFDTDFNNPENLPPASISFVYLKQILFSRDYEE